MKLETRKILVKIVALIVLAFGVWSVGLFFWPVINTPQNADLNLLHIFLAIIQFRIGYDLYQFKEFGRKSIIVILLIWVISKIAFDILVLFFSSSPFSFHLKFLNWLLFKSTDRTLFVIVSLIWEAIMVATIQLFLNRETKELFSNENKTKNAIHIEMQPEITEKS